jgi:hypothetical protein
MVAYFELHIFVERRKKNISQVTQCPGRNTKLELPEHKQEKNTEITNKMYF